MEPVTITITDELELAGALRARCYRLTGEIANLTDDADLDTIIGGTDSDQIAGMSSSKL